MKALLNGRQPRCPSNQPLRRKAAFLLPFLLRLRKTGLRRRSILALGTRRQIWFDALLKPEEQAALRAIPVLEHYVLYVQCNPAHAWVAQAGGVTRSHMTLASDGPIERQDFARSPRYEYSTNNTLIEPIARRC